MQVEVHFLGRPEIIINGEKVQIAQKKVEALVLYILFNENCTRDELAGMFWCDCSEDAAKRNLRNSLYKIRIELGEDFILTKGNSYVYVNPELAVERDTDIFIMEDNEKKLLELNNFNFMDKVYLKNGVEFEKWVLSVQNAYERVITQKLLAAMKNNLTKCKYNLAERYARQVLALDRHQEEACCALMRIYEKEGDFNKAIQIYRKFSDVLQKELDIEPDTQTQETYNDILKKKQQRLASGYAGTSNQKILSALNGLLEEFSGYEKKESYKTCFLYGDFGMGKGKILESFANHITKKEVYTIEFSEINRDIEYYGVYRVLEKLKEIYSYELGEVSFPNVFDNSDFSCIQCIRMVAKKIEKSKKRCCLIIKNAEFLDAKSTGILLSCAIPEFSSLIFAVIKYSSSYNQDSSLIKKMKMLPYMRLIELKPLLEKECWEYLQKHIEDKNINVSENEVYRYTAGNLQMIDEVAENINKGKDDIYHLSEQMMQKIDRMLSNLTAGEYGYLEYMAVMENGVEIRALAAMRNEGREAVMRELMKLKNCGLLEETGEKEHRRLIMKSKIVRDFVYDKISGFRRQELHRLAVDYYKNEKKANERDFFYLSELEYHSAYVGASSDHLYYEILRMHRILDYIDEFFPIVGYDTEILQTYSYSREEIYTKLYELKNRLELQENEMSKERFNDLKMEIYYLIGRALNRGGARNQGLTYSRELIEMAKEYKNTDMFIKGHIEAICYGVKAENATMMKRYLKQVKKIENLSSYEREYGTLLRLDAYSHILDGEYEEAETLLKKSLRIFESPRFRDSDYYKAAGAYDYLAITYRNQGRYEMAQQAMENVMRLCEGKNIQKGMDLFYEDYAYILFLRGMYDGAEHYFKISLKIYDTYGTYWMRSVAESCMAVIEMFKGNEKKSLEYFRRAEIFYRKEMTKEETQVLEYAREKLKEAKIL